jgi:hypothetical protein
MAVNNFYLTNRELTTCQHVHSNIMVCPRCAVIGGGLLGVATYTTSDTWRNLHHTLHGYIRSYYGTAQVQIGGGKLQYKVQHHAPLTTPIPIDLDQ